MRFEEAYQGWAGGHLTQVEAAMLLGQRERSFRRHIERHEADGLEGLRATHESSRQGAQASGFSASSFGFTPWLFHFA
jgi:hypothetical protein